MGNLYYEGMRVIHNGDRDLLTGTVRVLLLTDATSPSFDATHSYITQVLGDAGNTEAATASYTGQGATGRLTLASKSVLETGALVEFKAAKASWTALDGFTVAAAVVFFFDTDDTDSEAISMHDFTDKAANGSDFDVRWSDIDGVGQVFTITNS